MSTRVYLLRHAETATPHVFHGAESDVDLSERGRRQAQALAPVLSALAPAAVVSSAMRRAIATATPLADACARPLRIEPELHERKVGMLGGTSVRDPGIWPETVRRWVAGDLDYACRGAESFAADPRPRAAGVARLTTTIAIHSSSSSRTASSAALLLSGRRPHADWHRLDPTPNVAVTSW